MAEEASAAGRAKRSEEVVNVCNFYIKKLEFKKKKIIIMRVACILLKHASSCFQACVHMESLYSHATC